MCNSKVTKCPGTGSKSSVLCTECSDELRRRTKTKTEKKSRENYKKIPIEGLIAVGRKFAVEIRTQMLGNVLTPVSYNHDKSLSKSGAGFVSYLESQGVTYRSSY
jgi:hypothetical protein